MRRYVVAVTLGGLLAVSAGCGDSGKGTTTPKENVAIIPGGPQPGGAGQPAGGGNGGKKAANAPPGAGTAQ